MYNDNNFEEKTRSFIVVADNKKNDEKFVANDLNEGEKSSH